MPYDIVTSGTISVTSPSGTTYVLLGPAAALYVGNSGSVTGVEDVGGTLFVAAGGSSTDAVISNGVEYVLGTDVGTTLTLSSQHVYGGSATGAFVGVGSFQDIANGGTATGTILAGNQQVMINGTAVDTAVLGGASEYVGNGGTTNGSIISANGFEYVDVGGIANTTQVSGALATFGTANSTSVNTGGLELIVGTDTASTVYGGGEATVQDSGVANNMTIDGGGFVWVANGGTLNNTTLAGNLQVLAGGISNGDQLEQGGGEYVGAQGVSNGSVINNGAQQYVDVGGTANNAVVDGGSQFVAGNATGTTVNSGLSVVLGTSSNTTLSGGGDDVLTGGSQDNVTFSQTAASALFLNSGAVLTGTVSGFSVGDTIDFLNQTFSSASFDGSTLTLGTGSSNSSYSFANMETGTELVLTTDGRGGASLFLLAQASASQSAPQTTFTWNIPAESNSNTLALSH